MGKFFTDPKDIRDMDIKNILITIKQLEIF